jgi:plastocyanin
MMIRRGEASHATLLWSTGLLALVSLALLLAMLVVPRAAASQTIEIVVPVGTQERTDQGEQIVLFPRRLEVAVGDRLIITNEDVVTHQVGPYVVGSGQRIDQTFSTVGSIEGICTLHPSGEVTIVVR